MVACGRCLWASEAVWGQENAERVSERAFLIGIFGSKSNPQNQPNKWQSHVTQQGAKKSWKYLCIDFRVWTSPRSNLMMRLAPIPVQYWVNFIFFRNRVLTLYLCVFAPQKQFLWFFLNRELVRDIRVTHVTHVPTDTVISSHTNLFLHWGYKPVSSLTTSQASVGVWIWHSVADHHSSYQWTELWVVLNIPQFLLISSSYH
jgi:hypothetical protein